MFSGGAVVIKKIKLFPLSEHFVNLPFYMRYTFKMIILLNTFAERIDVLHINEKEEKSD
jgi:hypothetical protein